MRCGVDWYDASGRHRDVTFEEFVSARLGSLSRYATVVVWDAGLAEDIVQNVLVRAQRNWARIGRLDAPERYVKRMVLNEFLSWRRRRAAHVVPLSTASLDALTAPVPDATPGHDERDAMMRLIGTLPPRQRAVIALRFYEDLPVDEIAHLLDCRPATVRSHLTRALAALRAAVPASTAVPEEAS
jgi:RNA polymerase sigma-70 factor (sigma-E family)